MIIEVTAFKTSDGVQFETLQLAEAHEAFQILAKAIDNDLCLRSSDPEDIVKWIADNKDHVREFLDRL